MYEEKTLRCIECDKNFKKIVLEGTEADGFVCPNCSAEEIDWDE